MAIIVRQYSAFPEPDPCDVYIFWPYINISRRSQGNNTGQSEVCESNIKRVTWGINSHTRSRDYITNEIKLNMHKELLSEYHETVFADLLPEHC